MFFSFSSKNGSGSCLGSLISFFIPLIFIYFIIEKIFIPNWEYRKSTFWEQTTGIILHSIADHPEKFNDFIFQEKPIPTDISYLYQVGQQTYKGTCYSFQHFSNQTLISQFNAYTTGKKVPVFYDPKQPHKSVLIPGAKKDVWYIGFFLGLFFLIWYLSLFNDNKYIFYKIYNFFISSKKTDYCQSLDTEKESKNLEKGPPQPLSKFNLFKNSSKKKIELIFYWFSLFIFIFMGIFIVGLQAKTFYKAKQTENWIEHQGIIERSCVVYRTTKQSKGQKSTTYYVKTEIHYQLNHHLYQSEKLIKQNSNYDAIKKQKNIYAPNKPIIIFYNPKNPQEFSLEQGLHLHLKDLLVCFIGLVFFMLGIFLFFLTNKKNKNL